MSQQKEQGRRRDVKRFADREAELHPRLRAGGADGRLAADPLQLMDFSQTPQVLVEGVSSTEHNTCTSVCQE